MLKKGPWRPKHKYGARATSVNGFKFHSKKEARYYQELLLRQKAGEVIFFLRQVPFHLACGTIYRIDFAEYRADGTVHFIDVKGFKTQEYKLKKKMVEHEYPIEIEEV